MRKKIAKKLKAKKEAIAIIPELLQKAKSAYKKGNKRLSTAYSMKIKYLSMKHKLKLPKIIQRQLCKHCNSILIPSVNCRIRTNKGRMIYCCLECKKFRRIPIK